MRRDPGRHLLFQNQFRNTAGTVEQRPRATEQLFLLNPEFFGLKNYPDAHIIELRAAKCPLCSEDGEIILGLLGEGLEMQNPGEEGCSAAVSCVFKGL